jgi:1-acyl-sn-glycerol-3-phosphate acyltransferase
MKIFKNLYLIPYTIYAWAYVIFAMIGHFAIANVVALFYKDKEWGRICAAIPFLKFGLFATGIPLKVTGKENIPKEGNFIIIANHQSHLDIVMLLASIPRKIAFIAKKELLKVPILGFDLKQQGHVMIDRQNARVAIKQMDVLKKTMEEKGKSLLIFAEGTRSPDGKVKDFKKGAFQIAVQTGTTVVPCYVNGTANILSKKSFMMKPGKVDLVIGEPISIEKSINKEDERKKISELMDKTKNIILDYERSLS